MPMMRLMRISGEGIQDFDLEKNSEKNHYQISYLLKEKDIHVT